MDVTERGVRRITALLCEIESLDLLWRVSSPGVMGKDTRAEAMLRSQRTPWVFGFGTTVEEALAEVLEKWRKGSND